MIAGIIEFRIKPGREAQYDEVAAALHTAVQEMDGFISVERFESRGTPGKILSLSYWRDEQALAAWRNLAEHRAAMAVGKQQIFADYRIVVAEVSRDYSFRAASPEENKDA